MTALIAMMLALAAQDKPAEPPAADICLSNACSPKGPGLKPPSFKSVKDAVANGNAWAARDLGGSPQDAMDAIKRRLEGRLSSAASPEAVQNTRDFINNVMAFADTSDGSTLRFTDNTDFPASPGTTVIGAIERTGADGSVQNFWLTDNGGGIWVRPGFDPRAPGVITVPRPLG